MEFNARPNGLGSPLNLIAVIQHSQKILVACPGLGCAGKFASCFRKGQRVLIPPGDGELVAGEFGFVLNEKLFHRAPPSAFAIASLATLITWNFAAPSPSLYSPN